MKKKHHSLANEQHQLLIVFIVAIVAIVAIIAANNDGSGMAGAETPQTNCQEIQTCEQWEWADVPDIFCESMEINNYNVCVGYETINGEIACNEWETVLDERCAKWSEEVVWSKECTQWSSQTYC